MIQPIVLRGFLSVLALLSVVASANAQPFGKSASKGKPAAAPSKQGDVVGVLDVDTKGVSEIAAEKFEVSLEEGLKLHGFRVANRARMRELLARSEFLVGCMFGPCLREIHRRTKGEVQLVLVARITGEGSTYRFLISLLDTRTGIPTAQIPTTCTVCTVEEAIAAATLAVIELVAGTGDSAVLDPRGATGAATSDKPIEPRGPTSKQFKRANRTAAYVMMAAGAVAAGTSGVLFSGDNKDAGWAFLGGSAGLFAGSAVFWAVSRQF